MDKNEVEKTAKLARLNFSEQEEIPGDFSRQLNKILKYIGQLNNLDTADISPMSQPLVKKLKLADDTSREFKNKEELANNAPDFKDGFYRVKKIIE
ncbi:MAG: Asp-tRNA(Asn)/Glu-tRNA(Gln) amidotransferase subunit GatC [Elusimicrobia bacterium]|jgi:aspartyl-tRNA(Asn)/glutamyl-tRNA(Gln) amidotransferase subunit C|nr:Asp-tRNA(Asn)/Glu-tRNA(Gln) amidotransferase subunit GatC [Elusimicrobiota bacterium]